MNFSLCFSICSNLSRKKWYFNVLLVSFPFFLFIFFTPSPSPDNGGAKGYGSRILGVGEILFWSDASLPGGMHLRCAWATTYFLHSRREFGISSIATSTPTPTHACLATFLANRLSDNFRNGTPAVNEGKVLRILLLIAIFLWKIATSQAARFLLDYAFSDTSGGIATRCPAIRGKWLGLG